MDAEYIATILVVDDHPVNLLLVEKLLRPHYRVRTANCGAKALEEAQSASPPDLILLDVMMPDMSGYEVCTRLKANPATHDIPIIFVTAMSEIESEEQGLSLGAVDYLAKPISTPILLARVKNHLALRRQAMELEELNRSLAQRVADGVAQVERLSRLRRFFSPAVADMLLTGDAEDPLKTHRREIVVVFIDLRGYTSFTEAYGADEVMHVLGEFHTAMGALIMAYGATLERFAGDGMMIFFNDPLEMDDPAGSAVRMALAMQQRFAELQALWQTRGYTLSMGIGIAQGVATIGAIGFEGRRDYGAIGSVTNLAARLCGEARGGQILISRQAANDAATSVPMHALGEISLKGFAAPVEIFEPSANP
ncbi:MAG: response regulator [Sulfuritalea sp.]|jgi:adenylate cyclase|nr:response regulator [Sulfuritalea sp.]MBK9348987.1 response regulator [Sulfuritalea sp.]MBP6636983.1 response regulator [Sulfuritalea sp.]MBP7422519.1 response regulator [Sulfuritalea sp.]